MNEIFWEAAAAVSTALTAAFMAAMSILYIKRWRPVIEYKKKQPLPSLKPGGFFRAFYVINIYFPMLQIIPLVRMLATGSGHYFQIIYYFIALMVNIFLIFLLRKRASIFILVYYLGCLCTTIAFYFMSKYGMLEIIEKMIPVNNLIRILWPIYLYRSERVKKTLTEKFSWPFKKEDRPES